MDYTIYMESSIFVCRAEQENPEKLLLDTMTKRKKDDHNFLTSNILILTLPIFSIPVPYTAFLKAKSSNLYLSFQVSSMSSATSQLLADTLYFQVFAPPSSVCKSLPSVLPMMSLHNTGLLTVKISSYFQSAVL